MEPKATASSGGQPDANTRKAADRSLSESLAQGKEALGAAAAGAMDSATSGLHVIQDNVSAFKDTATHFVSETGADAASRAAAKAKSFSDLLESVVRGNPLGAILGAAVIGALLGMRGRGRRR